MDYLKSVVPSQLIEEKGSDIVVINPGSENLRIGLASWNSPLTVPHCIAHYINVPLDENAIQLKTNCEKIYTSPLSDSHQLERYDTYEAIASSFGTQIPDDDDDEEKQAYIHKADIDGYNYQGSYEKSLFTWTKVKEERDFTKVKEERHAISPSTRMESGTYQEKPINDSAISFRRTIYGEEAIKVAPDQPYILRHPIRRGHFNVSQFYSAQQVSDDLYRIWNWILKEKCQITPECWKNFSAVLVISETFDNREIKEMVSVILRNLGFRYAVVHQESLAAVFGNGVPTACVVNMGAQVTSILCIEDGVTLPATGMVLPYGGEDISRSLLWIQKEHHCWPPINTDPMSKPIDLLMLNKLKEAHCTFKDGECNASDDVCSYEPNQPIVVYRVNLSALNIPPMGLFFPTLFMPEEYPAPPRPWFTDYEDMLDDGTNAEFVRRPEMSEIGYPGNGYGMTMTESSDFSSFKTRKEDNHIGLAEAITNMILSTGRLEIERKLFSNILLVGGAALTNGLIGTVEERVLNAIPPNEAIDTVEVLQSKSDPAISCWKGGVILAILDYNREAWIRHEDWICNGIHIGSGRKYRDAIIQQTQSLWLINS